MGEGIAASLAEGRAQEMQLGKRAPTHAMLIGQGFIGDGT